MFALLKAIPLRWWLYAAGAAAIAFILWREHQAVHRAQQLANEKAAVVAQLGQANATIETMKADAALNRETSNALAKRLADLERDRQQHPLGRLRCLTADLPSATAQGGSTAGTTDPAAGRVDAGADLPTFDASPGLSEYQRRCAFNAAHQVTLQEFEVVRTH